MWGFPVHQWCSTTLREGFLDPRASPAEWSSPMVTTVESRRGLDRPNPAVGGSFYLAGKVYASNVSLPLKGGFFAAVAAL